MCDACAGNLVENSLHNLTVFNPKENIFLDDLPTNNAFITCEGNCKSGYLRSSSGFCLTEIDCLAIGALVDSTTLTCECPAGYELIEGYCLIKHISYKIQKCSSTEIQFGTDCLTICPADKLVQAKIIFPNSKAAIIAIQCICP
jgi:hypothetical protein